MVCAVMAFADDASRNTVPVIPEPSTGMLLLLGIIGSLISFARNTYNKIRRFFDIVISIVALIFSFPILVVAAILIKLDSPGPILYEQVRVGVNRRRRDLQNNDLSSTAACKRQNDYLGKPFNIYKLRTMRIDAESKSGAVWACKNDCRITRVGKFLRKSRIDEFPQFLNVLKGEMSFIGPRPERPEFVKQLKEQIDLYNLRFEVKPGITGLAQVRYKYTDSVEDTRFKLKYDLLYMKKMSVLLDLDIILKTVETVIFAKGAQ
jgi:lipopolysaccharide/colanic/teichoic acid biosynthesis glycosyltransferase